MLIGNSPAKIDEKGRIKVPTQFRTRLEKQFGREFFVTSTSGAYVRIYPLPLWMGIVEKLSQISPFHPVASRYLDTVNYYGTQATMDRQGRVLIQPLLRARAQMNGEVAVLGNQDHLAVWNRELFEQRLEKEPITEDNLRELASLA
jgi:transcriptional regulator MraZ